MTLKSIQKLIKGPGYMVMAACDSVKLLENDLASTDKRKNPPSLLISSSPFLIFLLIKSESASKYFPSALILRYELSVHSFQVNILNFSKSKILTTHRQLKL